LETQFSEEQVLINLGLTLKQARVYLAIAESGPSRIMEISKKSKVARPDVYPALEKLQQLGLSEKIIKNPTAYRAIPLKEGLSLLLEMKANQYEKLKADTETLRNIIETKKQKDAIQTANSQFVLIPEGKAVIDRIANAIEKVQLTMDLVLSWKRFSRGISDTFAEEIENAWAKNVKTRFIIERPSRSTTSEQMIQYCLEKPSCQLRFMQDHAKVVFGVYDKKEVFIITISETDLQSSPALWSNNDAMICLASNHFEMLWRKAIKVHQDGAVRIENKLV
jgi:sugar-specific transcriptional regulator TrmB